MVREHGVTHCTGPILLETPGSKSEYLPGAACTLLTVDIEQWR